MRSLFLNFFEIVLNNGALETEIVVFNYLLTFDNLFLYQFFYIFRLYFQFLCDLCYDMFVRKSCFVITTLTKYLSFIFSRHKTSWLPAHVELNCDGKKSIR